ncbi:fatty-acid oxidation protein subunit alpha [Leptolyngbya sp. Heron Island J]|uniref:element excision factor XisI family protein n=1 Tax=Leptolyngbya sp. Heron Island J TaxID=1385935 RepID=UPI0003B947F0|nr:element excision factor XisI family protein [Leptolyngbya sp. Heron Island J]ESA35645.1 fatty-acid oxidation protein subunit alpha [Leptolyngbya sp. Heron Island J]
MGWDSHRRVYGCVLHLDIKAGKIWIQQNMTEIQGRPRTSILWRSLPTIKGGWVDGWMK